MKIAVCDDNQQDLDLLSGYIRQYDEEIEVESFLTAVKLLKAFEHDFFDLVFLDIEMREPNGYQVAEILSKRPDAPLVIFVTNSNDYTIRGYEVAFRYVKKPISYQTFHAAIKAALEKIKPQKFSIVENGNRIILSIKEICFFEVFNYIVTIHTVNNQYSARLSLKNIEENLSGCFFARPHKSYLVNLNHVKTVSPKEVTLLNHTLIPIGRKYKKAFEQALQKYLRG